MDITVVYFLLCSLQSFVVSEILLEYLFSNTPRESDNYNYVRGVFSAFVGLKWRCFC